MNLFVSGIGTEVGKTMVSSILVEALHADYWKPVQAGDLHHTDTDKVRSLVSNTKSQFFPERYRLNTPASPHYAAEVDEAAINLSDFTLPVTDNHLIVEGAGGLLVPLNQEDTILDLIHHLGLSVVLVSRHYLGSINHTLLSIEALKAKGVPIAGIIFSGNEHPSTEQIIKQMGDTTVLGRIQEHEQFDSSIINHYAPIFKQQLEQLV